MAPKQDQGGDATFNAPRPPPLPPPDHSELTDIDYDSDKATASVDWEIPPLSLCSTSKDNDLDLNFKQNTLIKATEISKGRAKVQRELKLAGPYDTHRQRVFKIFTTVLMILGGIFLLNAVIVSLSLWRLSKLQHEDLDIRQVEVYDLHQQVAHAAVDIQFPRRWYFYLFRVTMHEPTTIQVYAPEAIRNDEQKWTPIFTVKVPTLTIGRGGNGLGIRIRDIPIQYGQVPLRDLVDYFGDLNGVDLAMPPRRVNLRVEFEVETTSYWIPIHFSHVFEQEIEVPRPPNNPANPLPMPTLEGIEYVEELPEIAANRMAIRLHIEYPRRDIPPYFMVKIPDLFLDVGYFGDVPQRNSALSSNAIAQVKILPHILTGDIPIKTPLTVEFSSHIARKEPLLALLTRIREGDFSWSIIIGMALGHLSPEQESLNYLQQWLSTFQFDMPIKEIARLAQFPISRFEKRAFKDYASSKPAIKMGLVQIDCSSESQLPRAVVSMAIAKEYLQSLLGEAFPPLTHPLPNLTFHALIDRTGHSPKEIFNVDIRHIPHPRKLKFLLYVGIIDLGTAVRAVDKATQTRILAATIPSRHHRNEHFNYNAIYLHVGGDRFLDKLLRVFEIQLSLAPGGGFSFRHGSRRPIKFSWGDDNINNDQVIANLHNEVNKMRHDLKLDVLTDNDKVHIQGGLTLHSQAPVEGPFVRVYWNAIDLSLYPVGEGIGHVELLHVAIQKSALRVSLATSLPMAMQRVYGGLLDFDIALRQPNEEVIDGIPALIKAWRHIAHQFEDPEAFPKVHVVGRIGDRRIDFPGVLPSTSQLLASNADVPRMVIDVIKTRVRIAGFTDAILHVLLELPSLGDQCTIATRTGHKVAMVMAISLPAIHANGCIYPRGRHSHKERISCLATVGLHPIVIGLDLLDGQFCDIRTRLAKPGERVYERITLDPYESILDDKRRDRSKGNSPIQAAAPREFLMDEETTKDREDGERDTLINYLPLSVGITDLRRALEAVDKLAGTRSLKRLKVSVGFSDRKALLLDTKNTSLLDRVINGVGQAIPLKIPLSSNKQRPKRPPIHHFHKKHPVKIKVALSSKNRQVIKGRLSLQLPSQTLPKAPQRPTVMPEKIPSLAFLLAVQWGRTLISLRHGGAWFKARISQGQVTFRLDESRIRLAAHHEGIPFTRNLTVEFALGMRDRHCSTATLRLVLGHLHNYAQARATDPTSRRLRKALKDRLIDFNLKTLPFTTKRNSKPTADGTVDGGRAEMGAEHTRCRGHTLKQQLRLSTVVDVAKRAWRHFKKNGKKMGVNTEKFPTNLVIKPRPYHHLKHYNLPCFLPNICAVEDLRRPPSSKKFMKAEVTLLGIVQPAIDIIAYGLGMLFDKLNFRAHPKYMAVKVRIPSLEMGLALNGQDLVQFKVDPVSITRVARLAYPQQHQHRHQKSVVKSPKNDMHMVMVHMQLAPGLMNFGKLLRPYQLDAGFNLNIDPVPKITRRGRPIPLYYEPLSVSLNTEGIEKGNLLSTMVALGMPEMPAGYIPSTLNKKGNKAKIRILRTSTDGMIMQIFGVTIPNPLPFAALVVEEEIKCSYVYKGHEFARVKLGKLTLVPGANQLKAYVKVSRSAFGKLRNQGDFIPEFSEFLAGLAMSQPLTVNAVIHFGRNFHLHSRLAFPRGKPAMGAFNEKNSYPDFRDVHEILNIGRAAPRAAWYAARQVARTLRENAGTAWSWTWKKLGGIYNWIKEKVWGGARQENGKFDRRLEGRREEEESEEEKSEEGPRKRLYKRSYYESDWRPRLKSREKRNTDTGLGEKLGSLKNQALDGISWAWNSVKNWWDTLDTKSPENSETAKPPKRSNKNKVSQVGQRSRSKLKNPNKMPKLNLNLSHRNNLNREGTGWDFLEDDEEAKVTDKQPDSFDKNVATNRHKKPTEKRKRSRHWTAVGNKNRPVQLEELIEDDVVESDTIQEPTKLQDYFNLPESEADSDLGVDKMTEDLLLDKRGSGRKTTSKQEQQRIKRRIQKNRLFNEPRRPSKTDDGHTTTIPKKWRKRIAVTKKAKKRFCKVKKRDSSPSHDSIPSSESEFDELLAREDGEPFDYYNDRDRDRRGRGRRGRKRSWERRDELDRAFDKERENLTDSGSSYEKVDPEYMAQVEKYGRPSELSPEDQCDEDDTDNLPTLAGEDSDGNSLDGTKSKDKKRSKKKKGKKNNSKKTKEKKKRHHKRAYSSSFDEESSTDEPPSHRSRLTVRKGELVQVPQQKAKSWGEMYQELKDTGNELYGRLMKNMQKINYHIALNNDQDFVVMIVGMLMHMEFKDKEGCNYGRVSDGLQAVLGSSRRKAVARVLLAPPKCQKDGLSNAQFLRCLRKNLSKAPVILPPKHQMSKAEAVKATSTMANYKAGPQIMDQFLFRNGLCIDVRPSLISVALARPDAPSREKPFQINLLITMNQMAVPNTPFSDPCHQSIQCIPSTGVDFHVENRYIRQSAVASRDRHLSIKPGNRAEHYMTTRWWNRKAVQLKSSLLIKFKFRFSYLNRYIPYKTTSPNTPGISLIFIGGGRKVPPLRHRTAYGYVGAGQGSVALVIDPLNSVLSIHRDGSHTPLMAKRASPFPPRLPHEQWNQVLVHYRPIDSKLIVVIYAEGKPEQKFVSVFSLNIPRILGATNKDLAQGMAIGMGTATEGYVVPTIRKWQILVLLPDLSKTRIYYLDDQAPVPHERGRFVVELRDRCDRPLGLGPAPIKMELVRVIPKALRRRNSSLAHTMSALPDASPQKVKLKPHRKSGVYLAQYRVGTAGSYKIRVAFVKKPKRVYGKEAIDNEWYLLEHQQLYVRNIW